MKIHENRSFVIFHFICHRIFIEQKQNTHATTAMPSHDPSEMPFGHKIKPSTGSDDNEDDDGHGRPLYPIPVDQPTKGGKPTKKPSKVPTKTEPPLKYDFDSYDEIDEDDEHDNNENKKHPQHNGGGYGPGFFNPTLTKHQYTDYDQGIYNNENYHHRLPPHQTQPPKPNQFNPYLMQHGGDGGAGGAGANKHELINLLGGNQNLPPHVRIEHILQHIQGANEANGDVGGHSQPPFGFNTQNGLNYPFGIQHPALGGIPNEPNQKVPIQPQGKFCCVIAVLLGCTLKARYFRMITALISVQEPLFWPFWVILSDFTSFSDIWVISTFSERF